MVKPSHTNTESLVPTYDQLMWPTIKALKALGGSGANQEIYDKIIEIEGYSEELQQETQEGNNLTKLEYRSAWARTYLKKGGAIDSSTRGVWFLTDRGAIMNESDVVAIPKSVRKTYQGTKTKAETHAPETWREELLSVVQNIKPDAFERLCKRILRENGFTKVEVTGGSGDCGIDGVGILRINLISFHVTFQCKRYKGSVGPGAIRDFRGSMIGRSDKGLFITTGNFTAEARKEANRDGAPAIDLIDGDDLCDLLKDLGLGVETKVVEDISLNENFFQSL